jgi:predicted transcriptional regulator
MSRNPCVCSRGTSIVEIAGMMRKLDIGMIPVCVGNEVHGAVTDRDLIIRAVADGMDAFSTSAAHVMSTEIIFCYEDQSLRDASALMEDNKVRRLLVMNRHNELVGILSLGDLALKGEGRLSGTALREISHPYPLHMSEDEHPEEMVTAGGKKACLSWFENDVKELEMAN